MQPWFMKSEDNNRSEGEEEEQKSGPRIVRSFVS